MVRTFKVIGVQLADRRIEEVAETTDELARERSFETRAACELVEQMMLRVGSEPPGSTLFRKLLIELARRVG
ncbi:hypothetical protein CFB52_028835 [Burkholderia sp. AU18528]|uniref:hypothetical protein n=1 Tax=Burkholderia sp. AU18528 TaxID=2015350 RepID=UPI000C0743AD|nr:hypothetical protein [Burkholderia sp. AU18528]PHP86104.1 hypothetical protein CFB52_028835 [Burkholderia sp. AU18528]